MACHRAAGSLHVADGGHEGGVSLQLAVDLQARIHIVDHLCCLYHLVDALMRCAALCREAAHCHHGIEAGDILCGLCRGDGDLRKLLGGRIGNYGAVGEYKHVVLAELAVLWKEHDERARHDGDARFGLEHLEGGAEHVRRGAEGAGNHGVGVAALDHEAA